MKKYSIYLRPYASEDYILINKWRNDPEIQATVVGPTRFVSLEMEKAWVHDKMMNNAKDIYWAICLNDGSDRMIGFTSLNEIDHVNKKCSLGGIVIGEKDCRDGVSFIEANLIKLDYLFNQLGMNRTETRCLTTHPVSPATVRALGFIFEGILHDYIFKNGEYQDLFMHALLRKDYYELLNSGEYDLKKIIKRFVKHLKDLK